CARGYTYWVSLTWGEGGWFAEMKDMTDGGTVVPSDPDSESPLTGDDLKTELLERADDVAEKDRTAIVSFTPSDLILPPPQSARPSTITPADAPSAKAPSATLPSG